ncbi:unnamed protein product [Linum tenue]|uniref:Uncharacterized protein n=1 Tax=Linum tenue TaxID=586396 RepID=A0AAV0P2F9_9ROSI|nr:unnamed protein product [Linum tenue]
MKRNSGNWVMNLLLVVGMALMMLLLNSSACISAARLPFPEAAFGVHTDTMVVAAEGEAATSSRKLQEHWKSEQQQEAEEEAGDVGLEDYRPIDPVPSSKAAVKPGPIEHGTPLNPFIPRSPPPTPPPSSY